MDPRDLILSAEIDETEVIEFLKRYGFQDSKRADIHIQRIVELVGLPERVANLLRTLLEALQDSVDPDAGLLHLESFLESAPSRLNLLSLLEVDPRNLETLIRILAASPFLTQVLVRNPEYFYWLMEKDRLERVRDLDYFHKVVDDAIRPFSDREDALNALRRLKRRENLRIGTQDMLGLVDMRGVVAQVSGLAEGVLQGVFDILSRDLLKEPRGFAVFGMGKLGGSELNFSSDVDLIYLYEREENREVMLRFAREFSKAVSGMSPEGHLYRVDLRLRPMGKGGDIAYSEKASRQYYQTWADTMDRLAMLKCRTVAGDRTLGDRFIAFMQDIVYKRYLDHAAVEEIHWVKKRTEAALSRQKEGFRNIKLGLGGIREVEFFVQSFQILYGGTQPEIRTPNTLEGLQRLVDFGFVPFEDFRTLRDAYVFMRDLEHKLQLVHDLQTHSLPEETQELIRCARRMGYRRSQFVDAGELLESFQRDLEHHHQSVRRIFEALFADRDHETGLSELMLNPLLPLDEAVSRLQAYDIRDPQGVAEGLFILRDAPAFPYSPTRLRNLLANLVTILVSSSQLAIEPRELFSRLDRFLEALGSRATLYSELNENPEFAGSFLALLAASPPLSETLIQNPELLDSMTRSAPPESVGERLRSFVSHREPEQGDVREALRIFKKREEFKIGVEAFAEPEKLESRERLTELAEACLHLACELAFQRHPWAREERFSILGLGKLGGRELIFHSDLDLVFVFDDRKGERTASDFIHFLRVFRAALQEYTAYGRAYEIDFRLRPEGRHTAEAIPVTQFESYFEGRCEAWEKVAYMKARPVFENQFVIPLHSWLFSQALDSSDREELVRIRSRKEIEIGAEEKHKRWNIKVGRGALLDIQFIVQFLQLQHQIIDSNTLSALEKLARSGVLDKSDSSILTESLEFYYAIESMQDLRAVSMPDGLSLDLEETTILTRLLQWDSPDHFLEHYRKTREKVREVFERVFRT